MSYRLGVDPLGRPMYHLTLTWGVDGAVRDDVDVRLRLVDTGRETVVWEMNEGRPVSGYTTTRAWRVGWVVDDYHAITLPAWVPGGAHRLDLQIAPRFEPEGLPVDGGSSTWYALGEVMLSEGRTGSGTGPQTDGSRPPMGIVLNPKLWLVDAQYPGEVAAGTPVELDLTWMCKDSELEVHPERAQIDLWWVSVDSEAEARVSPLVARGEDGVTLTCADGQVSKGADGRTGAVVRRYVLEAPATPGQYRLEVGRPEVVSARCRWLGPSQQACAIGALIVTPYGVGEASFDGRILLVSSSFDAAGVAAGGPMRVSLTWRAIQALDKDYTVFVQVVGPDGKLHGQVDTWPGRGARPTSGWAVGEEVVEAYEFYIDAGRPSGEYRVIVGWYLLADMTRLPVVDSSGVATGDFAEIGLFDLP